MYALFVVATLLVWLPLILSAVSRIQLHRRKWRF